MLTSLGSSIFLTIAIVINKTIIATPRTMSPFIASIIAQGIITALEPKIGNASTKDIPSAVNKGYFIFNPQNLYIVNPTKEIKNDISIYYNRDEFAFILNRNIKDFSLSNNTLNNSIKNVHLLLKNSNANIAIYTIDFFCSIMISPSLFLF